MQFSDCPMTKSFLLYPLTWTCESIEQSVASVPQLSVPLECYPHHINVSGRSQSCDRAQPPDAIRSIRLDLMRLQSS